jgi:hypothetical protein
LWHGGGGGHGLSLPMQIPIGGTLIHTCTFLGFLSTIALASLAIAVPSAITENTRLKTIIFFIVVGIKGFYIISLVDL